MGILTTILSWFGIKKQAPPELPELTEADYQPVESGLPPSPTPIDFVTVLAAAGVEADVRDRVAKAKQLLRSLPPEAASETKRQVVELAFKAFDIPTQSIIDGASSEIEALRSFIQVGEAEKTTKIAEGERHIAELEAQIRATRETMALVVAAQERRMRLTSEEIGTVEPILQFFVREEKPSAAPKLAKPSKAGPPKAQAASPEEPFAEPAHGTMPDESAASGDRP